MKKILLSAIVYSLGVIQLNAQQILNADFSESSFNPRSNSYIFSNWNGDAIVASNAFENSGDAAQVQIFKTTTSTCLRFGTSKEGRPICLEFGTVPVTITQSITQTISNITSIPTELVGDYTFSSNNPTNTGGIIVLGNFNGLSFRDTLKISKNETGKIKLQLKPFSGQAIGPLNSLAIQITSCFNCGNGDQLEASLVVDNLAFSSPELGLEDKFEIKNLFTPNPAKDKIFTTAPVEIFNLTGQLVLIGEEEINIASLEPGFYIVKSKKGFARLIKE